MNIIMIFIYHISYIIHVLCCFSQHVFVFLLQTKSGNVLTWYWVVWGPYLWNSLLFHFKNSPRTEHWKAVYLGRGHAFQQSFPETIGLAGLWVDSITPISQSRQLFFAQGLTDRRSGAKKGGTWLRIHGLNEGVYLARYEESLYIPLEIHGIPFRHGWNSGH